MREGAVAEDVLIHGRLRRLDADVSVNAPY